MQIKDLIEEDEKLLELPTSGAPDNALETTTYPRKGEEDLKNNSGDDEEDKSHYEWDEQGYKANFRNHTLVSRLQMTVKASNS